MSDFDVNEGGFESSPTDAGSWREGSDLSSNTIQDQLPNTQFSESTTEEREQPASSPTPPTTSSPQSSTPSMDNLTTMLRSQQQSVQSAPPPADLQNIYGQAQQLSQAYEMARQRVQAQLPLLPPQVRDQLLSQWSQVDLATRQQMMQFQAQAQHIQMQGPARELVIDKLVKLVKSDNKSINEEDMRKTLSAYGDANSVLIAARQYADNHRVQQVEQRKKSGVDKMGSAGTTSGVSKDSKDWKNMIIQGFNDMQTRGRKSPRY